jgi:hypothetical protein
MPRNSLVRARAKAHMPMVLLTLLSILQALALELLWTHIREHGYLMTATWEAALSWLQIAATLFGVLLIWLLYSGMVMRFLWVPTTSDTLYPFVIGILEFVLIAVLGPDGLAVWFVVLAALFGITTLALQFVLRRARLDGENDEWFEGIPPATLRDFYPVITVVATLAGLGIALGVSGHQGLLAVVALLVAIGAIAHQLYLHNLFWSRSMARED